MWDRPFQALPGFVWYGGFGTEIEPLFDSSCPTVVQAEGRRDGNPVYHFDSPAGGCFGRFTYGYQRFNPERTGQAVVSDEDARMIEYEEDATGFPPEFRIAERKEDARWDYVKIGGASHLLPVHAEFLVVYRSGERWRLIAEYTNHRHFESASRVDFQ